MSKLPFNTEQIDILVAQVLIHPSQSHLPKEWSSIAKQFQTILMSGNTAETLTDLIFGNLMRLS